MKIDTVNKYAVASRGEHVAILNPPRGVLSKSEALLFAAWLVVCADGDRDEFLKVLDAVEGT